MLSMEYDAQHIEINWTKDVITDHTELYYCSRLRPVSDFVVELLAVARYIVNLYHRSKK
jgi:hypothetical protein